MATPIPLTGLDFFDAEDEIQRIEVQALTNEDNQTTVDFLLRETRHAYQIISQRQNEVDSLQAEIAQLKKISVSPSAPRPAVLTDCRTTDSKRLSDVVKKFGIWKQQITSSIFEDYDENQIDINAILEDIEELEAAHVNYQSSVDSIITVLQNAQTNSNEIIAKLSVQAKASNERATTAKTAANYAAVAAVQNVGAISTENAKLRAKVAAIDGGSRTTETAQVNGGNTSDNHGMGDQNLKELLEFANKYADTAPILESNLGQLINILGQWQPGKSSDGQCCNCGSKCEIDFREYIRLFDESIENASCLQDRIATLESLLVRGSNISPQRLDSVIGPTPTIHRLQQQLDEAHDQNLHLKTILDHCLPNRDSDSAGESAVLTSLRARITELESQNHILEECFDKPINQISDAKTKTMFSDETREHVMIGSEELGDLHDEVDSLRRQVTSLTGSSGDDTIQKLGDELSGCQREKAKATTESSLLQRSLQNLQGNFDAVQAEVARLQEIIKGLRQAPTSQVCNNEIARLTVALAECQYQRTKDALEIAQADKLLEECIQRQSMSLPDPEDTPLQSAHANAELIAPTRKQTETFANIINVKKENEAIQERLDEFESKGSAPSFINVDIAVISARANRVQELEDKEEESEKAIASLQARIAAGDRKAGHQAEVDYLKTRVQELTDLLVETENDLEKLQEEHAEQTAAFEVIAPKITDLEAQRDRAEADLEREVRAGGDYVAELEARINDLQQQLEQGNANHKKSAVEKDSARLKKQIKDLTSERDDLQEQLDSVGQDPEQITTVKWLRSKRADLREELESTKRDLKERENRVAKTEVAFKRLEIALCKAEETAERIRSERTKALKERDHARKRLEKCETGGGSHTDLEALQAEVAKYKSLASVSNRAHEASEIEREKTRRDRDKAVTGRDAARRERDGGSGQSPAGTQTLTSRISELEKELEQSTELQQEAEDQFAEEKSILRNKIRDLEISVTNTQKLLDASRQTLTDAGEDSIRHLEQLKSQLQDERDSTQRLKNELMAAQANSDQPETDGNAALVRHLNFTEARLQAREQLIADMNTRLSSAAASKNVEAAELRRQLAVAQAQVLRLNINPTPDQEELTLLRQENDELNDKLQDLKDARRRLRNEQAETERLRHSVRDLCLKVEEGRCCEKAREASGWKMAGNAADEYIEAEKESRLATTAALEDDLKESYRIIANLSITLERNTRDNERQTSENLMNLTVARAQITSLTTKLKDLSPETDAHLWQKLSDCNTDLEAKEKLLKEQRDEFADLQLKVESAQTEVFKLHDEVAYLEKTNAGLAKQLGESLHGKKNHNPQYPSTIKVEFEKDEEIQELKGKLARKEAQLKSKKKVNRDPRAKFTDDWDDDELEETMVENERLRDRREKERKALVTKNRTLREQLKVAESKVAELTMFIDEDLQNESSLGADTALRSLIATLKEHNKRLQTELDDWKNNDVLKDRQRQITNLELEIDDLHHKLASTDGDKGAESGQKQSSQMSTDERNGYIIDIETWQQRVRELEEEIEDLKQEIVKLEEENFKLAEDLKFKKDFLDRVMNTMDNIKEEVQAIEEEEVETDPPYEDKASETSTEIMIERASASRDTILPAEDRRQSRELTSGLTGSSVQRGSSRHTADEKPATTRGKRPLPRAVAKQPEPESTAGRSKGTLKSVPEESAESGKRITRSSKRKTAITDTSSKQTKASVKKRKLK
ncbi:hypothetical protein ONS95_006611 [Cadophora gregata]|uniref:uncharacterized protein n=1 Tax=Cadophora gregata TaxID=51156 RepID=UPI0026DD9926|nr:uncharacterized protein ONS95_006611 [Cadophora gregata]KAK0101438.1 hypothetical protein ONS95_006611 [Cadophora gregata]